MLAAVSIMDFSYSFAFPAAFVQIATFCYVMGLLTRKELLLRVFLMTGSGFYMLYYFNIADQPLWEAIVATVLIISANLIIILRILRERTTWGMSADMLTLYAAFPTLNPGQFRRIMRRAEIQQADAAQVLCAQGQPLDALYLTIDGEFTLARGAQEAKLGSGQFLGEIAFLLDGPASATVTAQPGARYVRWENQRLKRLLSRNPTLSNAVSALFNYDIARKLSVSFPHRPGE